MPATTRAALLLAGLMLASMPLSSKTDSAPSSGAASVPEISRGTLVVAIASPKFIVLATDSRKTWSDGSHQDNSKKLFRVGKKRVLAIAGLASAAVAEVPGLTEEIAPTLEYEIEYSAGPTSAAGFTDIDDQFWNEPRPPELPPSWSEDVKRRLLANEDMPRYVWWNATEAPTESIVNIAATYHSGQPLEGYRLEGLLVGFRDNGEAKLEHMVVIPAWDTSLWGLPQVGLSQMWERLRTKDKVIYKTMGVTRWANWVLEGEVNESLMSLTKGYPAIEKFLARRNAGTTDQMTEADALALSKELIGLTSTQTAFVGRDPVQTAVIRPKENAVVEQPAFPRASTLLKFGTTRAGQTFTPDFPFDGERETTFAWCEIQNNSVPIPLGGNYFYGNKLKHVTLVYRGGAVHFGLNNAVTDSTLIIEKGADEKALDPSVLRLFTKLERIPNPAN
jgi:hypothetical protein